MKKKIKDLSFEEGKKLCKNQISCYHYSDKQPLEDYQKASRNCFFRYCDEIKQDLERLEKLEEALGKIEDILTDKYNHEKYPFPDDVIDAISEVIDNEII